MAENKEKEFKISQDDSTGFIMLAEDVMVAIIGLAVTEVDGVAGLPGGISRDNVAKLGKRSLAKVISVTYDEEKNVRVAVAMEVKFGVNIMDVSRNVQERVKQALQTMLGITASAVSVRVAGIVLEEEA